LITQILVQKDEPVIKQGTGLRILLKVLDSMVLTNLSGDNAVVSEFLVLRSIFYVDRVQV